MKTLRTGLGLLAATTSILALPPAALGAYLVPPGNSAATQYTEAYPTAGGPKHSGPGGRSGHRSPADALGGGNARRLDAQGPEGRAAAALAAATAPSPSPAAGHPAGGGAESHGGAGHAAGSGSKASGSSGSSGLGEVLAAATGLSSGGQTGPLLPIAIVATIAWLLAYTLRRRKTPAA
jgi:hypothetical protein